MQKGASLQGSLVANGEPLDLPYAYAYVKKEDFHEKAEPAWELIFVQYPIKKNLIDEFNMDSPCIRIGLKETALFEGMPQIQVSYQELRLFPGKGQSLYPTTKPKVEITTAGPDRIAGRVFYTDKQEELGATFQYDYRFDIPLTGPEVSIGELLPVGGGAPGLAYRAWVSAVHAGDKERIKSLLPPGQAAVVDAPAFKNDLKFIRKMTPLDIRIRTGSRDGETALLKVSGSMAGREVKGEITMKYREGKWIRAIAMW
jgi:hypothetical protein